MSALYVRQAREDVATPPPMPRVDVVFLGTVTRVEPAPHVGCGIAIVMQRVAHRVRERVLETPLLPNEVTVEHPVCNDPGMAATVDTSSWPTLRRDVFAEGASLLVMATCVDVGCQRWASLANGAVVVDASQLEAIRGDRRRFGDARVARDIFEIAHAQVTASFPR